MQKTDCSEESQVSSSGNFRGMGQNKKRERVSNRDETIIIFLRGLRGTGITTLAACNRPVLAALAMQGVTAWGRHPTATSGAAKPS